MDRRKACAYLSIECCQFSKSTIQLVKGYKCDSLLHHLCQTDYASLKGLVERDNVGEHKVCPNLSCLRTSYIINYDTIMKTLPDLLNLHYRRFHLNIFSNLLATKRSRRYFWEVNSARCVGADKEFIGKARCKLCIERPHYVSAISGTKSLSFHFSSLVILIIVRSFIFKPIK